MIPGRPPEVGETIACANQKGGVGKTTTVVNLATYLALAGERILVVDLDPQGNATSGFGVDRSNLDLTVYDALVGGTDLGSTIVATGVDGCSLAPASVSLAGAEVELAGADQRELRPSRGLGSVQALFDHVP